jgi:hypothetical protein
VNPVCDNEEIGGSHTNFGMIKVANENQIPSEDGQDAPGLQRMCFQSSQIFRPEVVSARMVDSRHETNCPV